LLHTGRRVSWHKLAEKKLSKSSYLGTPHFGWPELAAMSVLGWLHTFTQFLPTTLPVLLALYLARHITFSLSSKRQVSMARIQHFLFLLSIGVESFIEITLHISMETSCHIMLNCSLHSDHHYSCLVTAFEY
jgi:hypothetical protein